LSNLCEIDSNVDSVQCAVNWQG